jgi:hypothetical protein
MIDSTNSKRPNRRLAIVQESKISAMGAVEVQIGDDAEAKF